ncbi:MAG: hypothetical protein KF905_11505 [Flavobacteriales bacterium]|nr:hypothetical protein [Flavobacteriales bacterium]
MRHALTLVLAILSCIVAFAQAPSAPDRILLMNGQIIETKVMGQSSLEVRYLDTSRSGLIRERSEPTSSVFSVTDSLGRERIWYFHDTIFGNDLTIEQMRWFIKGEQDARIGYKPVLPVLGGFLLGAGLTTALDLEVNALLLPPLYAGIMAMPRVHVTFGSVRDPYMEGNEFYALGYAKVGRGKRVVRSLISTAAGVVTGYAVRQLVINPNL